MSKRSLLGGTIILAIAGLITRILGFVYRIYMSHLIGAEGMGLFQLVFPIYMLGYTLSSAGISVAVSKLVAEENAKKSPANAKKILHLSLVISVGIAWILMMILLLGSNWISQFILKDQRTALSLGILAFSLPFMAAASTLKGYFYGLQEMDHPAASQVIEQIARMASIYFLAGWFIPKGLVYACAVSAIGMTIGEMVSFAYIYIAYKRSQKKKTFSQSSYRVLSTSKGLAAILSIAMPLTMHRGFSSILQSVETIMIPSRLQLFGLSYKTAISLYGQLSGMAMPLIFFPSIITNSLSMTLIPAISEASALKNKHRVEYASAKSLQISLIVGIGTACLFILFSHPLAMLIYRQEDVGKILYSLAWLCPFLYFQSTLGGILNGLGEQMASFRHSIGGSGLRIFIIYFGVPLLGIQGFIWAMILSALLVTSLHLNKIVQKTNLAIDYNLWILKPALAGIGASFITLSIQKHLITPYFSFGLATVLSICFLALVYLLMIGALGCFSREDLKVIRKNM